MEISRLIRLTNKPLTSIHGVDLKENVVFDALYCDFVHEKIINVHVKSDDSMISMSPVDAKTDFNEFQIPLVNVNVIPLSPMYLDT